MKKSHFFVESGGTDEKVNSDPGLVDGSCCTCAAGDCRPAAEPIKIKCYTMRNDSRMTVRVINWGATIVSIKCPDKYGDPADVVLGFDDMKSLFFAYMTLLCGLPVNERFFG